MDPGEEEAVVAQHAQEIFEFVLWEWYTEPSAWPPVRDLEVFREWFDVETHCIVVDLGNDLIERDEFEENG
jgi:hypothetical protein